MAHGATDLPRLDPVSPWAPVDEITPIRLSGVPPGQAVTLRLRSVWVRTFESQAVFHASHDGVVDVAKHAPLSGTYEGIDRTGLFWSRVQTDAPVEALEPEIWQVSAEVAGQVVDSFRQKRLFHGPGVLESEVREDGLVGSFFTPAGYASHPAVLVLGGSEGGSFIANSIAGLLASRGYAALGLAYFGMDGLPAKLDRIPLEYFERALAWLARHARVDAERIAVIGVSRGGELALLLGATYPRIRAVVAYVPSGFVHGSYPPSGRSAWTLAGEDIPYKRGISDEAFEAARREAEAAGQPTDWLSIHRKLEPSTGPATIRVECINGPVLLISGRMDGLWASEQLADIAFERLQTHGFTHRFEHLRYNEAGHAILWPNEPTTQNKFIHPTSGVEVDRGGTARGTAHASTDSWARMLGFLATAFGR